MEFRETALANEKTGEIISDKIVLNTVDDAVDLLGNAYYQGFDAVAIRSVNIDPEFFDLKTKLAGEILQKFSNYRMKLYIIGDFSNVGSNSLRDFIRESNRMGQVFFVADLAEIEKKQA